MRLSKANDFGKDELLSLLAKHGAQHLVAKEIGCSQMSISRRAKALGISFDGRARANACLEKRKRQSAALLEAYKSGAMVAAWQGKKQPAAMVARRVASLRGKPSWNSGLRNSVESVCEVCHSKFSHPQQRSRRFCSRRCSGAHMSEIYRGRFVGEQNPNFGNTKVKELWKAGHYANRLLSKHGRGIGGYVDGIWLRSRWEILFAEDLNEAGMAWLYEPKRFQLACGKSYTPDFLLDGVWVEIKGYWTATAREKFTAFLTEHPEEKIIVLGERWWNGRLNLSKRQRGNLRELAKLKG